MFFICLTFVYNKTYGGFVDFVWAAMFLFVCLLLLLLFFREQTRLLFSAVVLPVSFSARHAGISVWALTQQITSISKQLRENVAAIVLFYTPSGKTTKAIFEDYAGERSSEEYKKLIAELKKKNCPIWPLPCTIPTESKCKIENFKLRPWLNKMRSTNSCKCWRPPPDSSKPILVSLSPPNKFQKNVWSWLFLFPRANRTRHLFPNLHMKWWNAFQTERLKKIANGIRPTMTGRQLRLCLPAKPLVWLSKWMTKKLCKKTCKKISLLTLIVLCGWIYGTALHCLLVVSNAAMITTKHADFEPENGPEKEPDKELQKLFTMLYKTWKRKLTHLLKFQGKLCQRFLQQNLQKSWPSCGWKLFSWTKPPCTWGKKMKENTTAAPTEQKQAPTAESDSWKVNA